MWSEGFQILPSHAKLRWQKDVEPFRSCFHRNDKNQVTKLSLSADQCRDTTMIDFSALVFFFEPAKFKRPRRQQGAHKGKSHIARRPISRKSRFMYVSVLIYVCVLSQLLEYLVGAQI